MLLLKNEKKLLKILRKNKPDMPRNVFSYEYLISNFYKGKSEELYSVVRSLTQKEVSLISVCKTNTGRSIGIFLENTGVHFYEYLAIKRFTAVICYLAGLATPYIFSIVWNFLLSLIN